jgi:hypothetical protein
MPPRTNTANHGIYVPARQHSRHRHSAAFLALPPHPIPNANLNLSPSAGTRRSRNPSLDGLYNAMPRSSDSRDCQEQYVLGASASTSTNTTFPTLTNYKICRSSRTTPFSACGFPWSFTFFELRFPRHRWNAPTRHHRGWTWRRHAQQTRSPLRWFITSFSPQHQPTSTKRTRRRFPQASFC